MADILPTRSQADIMRAAWVWSTLLTVCLFCCTRSGQRQKTYAWNKKQKQIIFEFFFEKFLNLNQFPFCIFSSQFFTDRSYHLAQIRYLLMLRWRRFCHHVSVIEKLYPHYKVAMCKRTAWPSSVLTILFKKSTSFHCTFVLVCGHFLHFILFLPLIWV